MADLTQEEREAYEDQYTRGLRKMRDFRIYTRDFVDEVDCLATIWPERVILEEHKVPQVKYKNAHFVNFSSTANDWTI